MKKTFIIATLGIVALAGTAVAFAHPQGWGDGRGYGARHHKLEQPYAHPGRGHGGGWLCQAGAHDPSAHIAHRLERMDATLGLTDTQQSEIASIMKEQYEKRAAQREENRGRILAVLDEGQRAQVDQFAAQRCKGHRGQSGHRVGPRMGQGAGQAPGQPSEPAAAPQSAE